MKYRGHVDGLDLISLLISPVVIHNDLSSNETLQLSYLD